MANYGKNSLKVLSRDLSGKLSELEQTQLANPRKIFSEIIGLLEEYIHHPEIDRSGKTNLAQRINASKEHWLERFPQNSGQINKILRTVEPVARILRLPQKFRARMTHNRGNRRRRLRP